MAQDSDRDELTEAGTLLGSPRYMSPEQLRSSEHLDARTDIWSIGAISYELLVGHPPFLAHSTPALCVKIMGDQPPPPIVDERSDVSPKLEAVILACLERDVDRRIPDVATLASRLADAVRLAWIAPAAKRVAAVLERRGTQQGNASSTTSSSQSRSGLMGPMNARALDPNSDICDHGAKTEVAWTQSGPLRTRKRTWAAVSIAGVVVVAAVWLVALLRNPAGHAQAASVSPPASSPAASSALPSTATPSSAGSPLPDDSHPTPVVQADASSVPGKKSPGPSGPVGTSKGAAVSAKPPAHPTSPRPPVNPLDDRQ